MRGQTPTTNVLRDGVQTAAEKVKNRFRIWRRHVDVFVDDDGYLRLDRAGACHRVTPMRDAWRAGVFNPRSNVTDIAEAIAERAREVQKRKPHLAEQLRNIR